MSLVHRIPSMMLECTNVAVGHLTLILQESHLDDAMEGIFHPERQSSIPEHGHGREDKEGQGYFRSASFDMGAYGHPLEDQVTYFCCCLYVWSVPRLKHGHVYKDIIIYPTCVQQLQTLLWIKRQISEKVKKKILNKSTNQPNLAASPVRYAKI